MTLSLNKLVCVLIVLFSTGFALWKAQYGIEFYDEPFYLAPGFHVFSLGDKAFTDETHNGPRQNDWLNYIFLTPFLPYEVLTLRFASILLYSCLLALCLWVCFNKGFLTASLLHLGLLNFVFLLIPSWSHSHWARNGLIVHQVFLLASLGSQRKKYLQFAAGMAIAVSVVAYNTLLAPLFFVFLMAYFLFRKQAASFSSLKPYLLGVFFVLLIDAVAILFHFSDFLIALKTTLSVTEYVGNLSQSKIILILGFILSRGVFWFFIFLFFVQNRNKKWTQLILLLMMFYLIYRCASLNNLSFRMLEVWAGLGLSSSIYILYLSLKRKCCILFLIAATSLGCALMMAVSSSGANSAVHWALSGISILGLSELYKNLNFISKTLLGLWLLLVALLTVYEGSKTTYRDGRLSNTQTYLNISPFKGIYTTERKVYLFSWLSKLTENKKFVLTVGALPLIYLFPGVRAATDTIFTDLPASKKIHALSLTRMVERKRWPDLILKVKSNAWSWGHDPLTTPIDENHLLQRFSNCISDKLLIDLPEFSAHSVLSQKIPHCVQTILY